MERDKNTQQPPDDDIDLIDFPERHVREGTLWYRTHKEELGPGYFASDIGGRFNLAVPFGTWYVANTPHAAAQEAIGPDFVHFGYVTDQFVDQRSVSSVAMPSPVTAAKLTADSAFSYRVSNELATLTHYGLCQQWAAAFHGTGFCGIWYKPRFSPGKGRALAVFGEAGPFLLTPTRTMTLRAVVQELTGVTIVDTQDPNGYEVLDDPLD